MSLLNSYLLQFTSGIPKFMFAICKIKRFSRFLEAKYPQTVDKQLWELRVPQRRLAKGVRSFFLFNFGPLLVIFLTPLSFFVISSNLANPFAGLAFAAGQGAYGINLEIVWKSLKTKQFSLYCKEEPARHPLDCLLRCRRWSPTEERGVGIALRWPIVNLMCVAGMATQGRFCQHLANFRTELASFQLTFCQFSTKFMPNYVCKLPHIFLH